MSGTPPSIRTTQKILAILESCNEVTVQQFYAAIPNISQNAVRSALNSLRNNLAIECPDRGVYCLARPKGPPPKRYQFQSSLRQPTKAQLMAGK